MQALPTGRSTVDSRHLPIFDSTDSIHSTPNSIRSTVSSPSTTTAFTSKATEQDSYNSPYSYSSPAIPHGCHATDSSIPRRRPSPAQLPIRTASVPYTNTVVQLSQPAALLPTLVFSSHSIRLDPIHSIALHRLLRFTPPYLASNPSTPTINSVQHLPP